MVSEGRLTTREALCALSRNSPWADGMSLDGAVGNGPLCKLCGTPPGREQPTPEGRTHLAHSLPNLRCKVLQWFPHGAPLFSRSRMDHLTPGKNKWISPDRAPRSQKTQMCLGVHSLGRALARQNTRPDMSIMIKQCHPHDRWKKKLRLNRLHRPRHATPRRSQVRSRLPAKAIGRRHAAKAGAEHYLPVRG